MAKREIQHDEPTGSIDLNHLAHQGRSRSDDQFLAWRVCPRPYATRILRLGIPFAGAAANDQNTSQDHQKSHGCSKGRCPSPVNSHFSIVMRRWDFPNTSRKEPQTS